jgi:hypothetical protein
MLDTLDRVPELSICYLFDGYVISISNQQDKEFSAVHNRLYIFNGEGLDQKRKTTMVR